MSNPRSAGRVLLPEEDDIPSASPEDESGISTRPTAPSSPRLPLTPYNTFADPDEFDFTGTLSSSGSHSFHLNDLSDELLEHVEPADDNNENEATWEDTRSEPLPDVSGSSDETVIHTRPSDHQRSSSLPSRPLRSALVASPPPITAPDTNHPGRKKARFDDDAIMADLITRRTVADAAVIRRRSEPATTALVQRVLDRTTTEPSTWNDTDEAQKREADEVAVALELFEEVVEELVHAVEEHAEAHDELAEIAQEVAEAILESREEEYEGGDEDDDEIDDSGARESHTDEVEESERSSPSSQSQADEDVDESCFEDPDISFSEADSGALEKRFDEIENNYHGQPEPMFLNGKGELKGPDLTPILEEPSSSTETVSCQSSAASKEASRRRLSDPEIRGVNLGSLNLDRRRASMTDFAKLKGRLKLLPPSPKGSLAGCAVTACTVQAVESPKMNTMYQHPGARYKTVDAGKKPSKTAQTVRSDSGTFQVLWVEPPPSSSSSDVTLLESSGMSPELVVSEGDIDILRTQSPMDKVKTKLAAWSWAKEQGLETEHGGPNWIPLLSFDAEGSQQPTGNHTPRTDEPFAPPNTERPSGASSAKHSMNHSPQAGGSDTLDADDDEDEQPLELKVKATLSRPPSAPPQNYRKPSADYLSLPIQQSRSTPSSPSGTRHTKAISRQLSNLPASETHFQTHRDSVILSHLRQTEGRMNQHLMNSRDSVVLTRSKFHDRYPKPAVDPRVSWARVGRVGRALSPIPDASPPDARIQSGLRAMAKVADALERKEGKGQANEFDGANPGEHEGCPIYEVERPRWFQANCKKGAFV